MEAKGLGTPATRAAVIEGLLHEDYIHRNGRELVPTPKAFSLFFALKHFGVTEITSPELTGDWEHKLKLMEAARLPRAEFMDHIEQVTRDLVERIRGGDIPDDAFAIVPAPCPKCGGTVQENYRKFQCQKCDFSLWRVTASREWAPEEVAELISKRFVGPLSGFRSRMGKPFSAGVKMTDDFRAEFDFGQPGDDEEAPDFSSQESLGACPKCGARVFEHGVSYVCEKSVGPGRTCDFRSGKMILQQPVEREQMQKLLASGRTDLLTQFVSKRNRRFKAFLVKTPEGKVGFEFQPRAERPRRRPHQARRASQDERRRAFHAAPRIGATCESSHSFQSQGAGAIQISGKTGSQSHPRCGPESCDEGRAARRPRHDEMRGCSPHTPLQQGACPFF
jgi:DNA topoisomerase-3